MSLKHGILGLLNYNNMTGYELDKKIKESLNFFWQSQTSQVYREVNNMEKKGWLKSEKVIQLDKPNKKIYSITDTGKQELINWLSEYNDETFFIKSELMVKVFFSGEKDYKENIEFLKNYKQNFTQKLKQLQKVEVIIDKNKTVLTDNKKSIYWQFTADFGIEYLKMCIEWAEKTIKKLEEL